MGKKNKRRQTTSSKKGSNAGDNHNVSLIANPMAEERIIRTNEDGQILTDSYYQFLSLIRSGVGEVGVMDLNKAVELYAKLRQDNQFLSFEILLLTIQKYHAYFVIEGLQERSEINTFILTILEDHEEFVKRHVDIEWGGFDQFAKVEALAQYANVCKRLGKYNDSQKYYDEAFLILKDYPQEDDLRRIDGQARIRSEQADLTLIRSIGEQKAVTKEARRDSIDKWNESSKLSQEIIDNAKPGDFPSLVELALLRKYRCHLLIGIEYGKLKQWDDAQKHLELTRKIGQNDKFSEVDIGMVFMWMGKLHFDRYIDNCSTIAHDEQNGQNLIKAQIQTSIAWQKLHEASNKRANLYLFRAHISYFLGDTHKAINLAIVYLIMQVSDISGCSCNACEQPHRNKEVKYYCTACNAVFYCSKICQYKDWKGENEIFVKHRLFCPLLKSWKKLCKMRPEVENMTIQEILEGTSRGIEDVIRNTEFENMFQRYFESLRTVKTNHKTAQKLPKGPPQDKVGRQINAKRRRQLRICDDENKCDLGVGLEQNTHPLITKITGGSFILSIIALLVACVAALFMTNHTEK
uniref:MYND-type domain-containing protein n=1 Tax=Chaetoceros debilis TaxID=122233 RepID=A0A7S3QIG9_9STRA